MQHHPHSGVWVAVLYSMFNRAITGLTVAVVLWPDKRLATKPQRHCLTCVAVSLLGVGVRVASDPVFCRSTAEMPD